jgi:hypothetical protein
MAVDAAGDIFIADALNNRIVEVPVGCASSTCNVTVPAVGLNYPQGMTLDGAGNVFIGDSQNNRVVKVQLSQPPALSFANTTVDSTGGPQSVTIQDIGNQPLDAVSPGLVVTGPNFVQVAGSGTPADCTNSFALTPGAICNLSISFEPQSTGSLTSTAVFTDNALNSNPSASQSVALQGTGTPIAQTITFTTPAPATAKSGDLFTVAATGGASGNPVTFTVGVGSVCTNSGTNGATYTMTSNTGYCFVVANQAGSSNYSAATQVTETVTAVKTVKKIAQTVTFTGAPESAAYLSSFTVATTQNSGVKPTITSTTASVCTVSGTTVKMKNGTGTCTVKASWATNDYYLAASLTQSTSAELLGTTTTINKTVAETNPLKVEVYFTVANGTSTAVAGNVTVSAEPGGKACTGTVASGKCLLMFTAAGSETLTAIYAGNTDNSTSTSAAYPLTVE